MAEVTLGLVCFRLKSANALSQNLLFKLNDSGKIHMVPAMLDDKYTIRFCVNGPQTTESDMQYAWDTIRQTADETERGKQRHRGGLRAGHGGGANLVPPPRDTGQRKTPSWRQGARKTRQAARGAPARRR